MVAAIGLPNRHVADMLGISVASMHRYLHGQAVIPKTVGLLVQLLSKDASPGVSRIPPEALQLYI